MGLPAGQSRQGDQADGSTVEPGLSNTAPEGPAAPIKHGRPPGCGSEAGPQLSPATRFSGRCHHGGCNAKWNQIRTDRSPARAALQASSSSASLALPFLSAGTRTHHFAHVCCGVSPAAGPAKPEQTSNLSTRSESGQEGGCLPTAPRAPER